MPKKLTTTAARRAREAAEAGGKYTAALRAEEGPGQAPETHPSAVAEAVAAFWRNHHELEEAQESGVDPLDPYFVAGILDRRALIWGELSQAADSEAIPAPYSTACAYAAILDQEHAARVRFAHGIPTILPKTEASKLHLDEMRCRSCGQPWQTNRPCAQCPRILWGATPTSIADAEHFADGEPWPRPVDADEDQAPREEPLAALVQRAAEERAAGIRHPRWHRPGKRPEAVAILNRVYLTVEESVERRAVSLDWRRLFEQLADVRGEMSAQRAALEAARAAVAVIEETGQKRHYAAGTRRAEAAVSRIWTELDRVQQRYVQLAVHALAATAGEADPGALPAQPDPDAFTFTSDEEPEPFIPEALAALGFALPHVHRAMPTSGRLAESLQWDYDRAFGLDDDHECDSDDGRCTCEPYSVPERMIDQANEMEDEISHAWEAYREEAVVWADSVCIALATELRPRVLAHEGSRGWSS